MRLEAIPELGHVAVARAVGAAKHLARRLHAMADDLALAVRARGGQRRDGALKTIEYMRITTHNNLERLFVGVTANLTSGHLQRSSQRLWVLTPAPCAMGGDARHAAQFLITP